MADTATRAGDKRETPAEIEQFADHIFPSVRYRRRGDDRSGALSRAERAWQATGKMQEPADRMGLLRAADRLMCGHAFFLAFPRFFRP
jgi:hypothetical protein